jgi:hypothetical protein
MIKFHLCSLLNQDMLVQNLAELIQWQTYHAVWVVAQVGSVNAGQVCSVELAPADLARNKTLSLDVVEDARAAQLADCR